MEREKWDLLRERFGNKIMGIDKRYLRTFPRGFAVRVLMSTGNIEDRKRFAQENRSDIIEWVTEEIAGMSNFMKKIGSLDYYRPTDMIILQSSEIEIIFEVKESK